MLPVTLYAKQTNKFFFKPYKFKKIVLRRLFKRMCLGPWKWSPKMSSPNSNHIGRSVSFRSVWTHLNAGIFQVNHVSFDSHLIFVIHRTITLTGNFMWKGKDGVSSSFCEAEALCQWHGWQAENCLNTSSTLSWATCPYFGHNLHTLPYTGVLVIQCLNIMLSGVSLWLENQTKPNQMLPSQ